MLHKNLRMAIKIGIDNPICAICPEKDKGESKFFIYYNEDWIPVCPRCFSAIDKMHEIKPILVVRLK